MRREFNFPINHRASPAPDQSSGLAPCWCACPSELAYMSPIWRTFPAPWRACPYVGGARWREFPFSMGYGEEKEGYMLGVVNRCPPQGVEVKNHCTGPMKNGVESILDIGHVPGIGNNKGFETQNRFSGAGGRRVPPLPLEAILEALAPTRTGGSG